MSQESGFKVLGRARQCVGEGEAVCCDALGRVMGVAAWRGGEGATSAAQAAQGHE